MSYEQYVSQNPKLLTMDPIDFPSGLSISTMTLVCKLPIFFDTLLIATKIPLSVELIQTVTHGNNGEICRSVVPVKHKKKQTSAKKKNKKNFYNQVTMVVKSINECRINVKLFKNGSIQITGCKLISVVLWILDKIFTLLKEPFQNAETHKCYYFANPYIFLDVANLTNFKIAMINSNFKIGFRLSREKLFDCLNIDKYDCSYDSSRHAGVIIKYQNTQLSNTTDTKKQITSILIFDKGSVIITGAKCYRQIMECYKFINAYLINKYIQIHLEQ
jgi:TATA-box binding protein (TBP) (component of TFIID and TFIIIB)